MLIRGDWLLCDDGSVRPILVAEFESEDGTWVKDQLLVDTGADRTVFSRALLQSIRPGESHDELQLGGIGGYSNATTVRTKIRMTRDDGQKVTFGGEFAAFTQDEALDMSVLGRDVLNLFAVIIDKPGNAVCTVGQRHGYRIEETS